MRRPLLRPFVTAAFAALPLVVAAPALPSGEPPRAPCEPVSGTCDEPAPRAFRAVATEYSHGDPTSDEQLFLELMNRARLDPSGEGDRIFADYGDKDVKGAVNYFLAQRPGVEFTRAENRDAYRGYTPQPPFAFNAAMIAAARAHTAAMLAADEQSHQLPGEGDLGDRLRDAGYDPVSFSESVFCFAKSMLHAHAGFAIDWGQSVPGGSSRPSLGHRNSLMNFDGSRDHVEVGIGVSDDSKPSTRVGPKLITIDFAQQAGSTRFVTGVCYSDRNSNGFYDVGEGLAGVRIQSEASSFYTVSSASGGYALPVPANAGSIVVRATGEVGGPSEMVGVQDVPVTMAGANVKVDFTRPIDPPPPAAQTFTRAGAFALAGSGSSDSDVLDVASFDGTGTLSDVDVNVTLSHPDASKVRIEIVSPAGTPVVLWDHGLPLANLSGTFDDTLAPAENPGRLAGESYVGRWTLRVTDDTTGGANSVATWGVTVRPSWVRPFHADRTNLTLSSFKATDSAKAAGDSLKLAGTIDASGSALASGAPVHLRLLRDDLTEIRRFVGSELTAPASMSVLATPGAGGTSKATFKAVIKGIDFAEPLPSSMVVEMSLGGAVARQRIVTTKGTLAATKPPAAPFFRVATLKSSIPAGGERATTITGQFGGGLTPADTIEVVVGDQFAVVPFELFARKGNRWTSRASGVVKQVVLDSVTGAFTIKLQGDHEPLVGGVVPFSFRVGTKFGDTVIRPSGTSTLKY